MLQYRPDIDGLRAVAVTSVVLGHAGIAGFSGGYVGVDVFFVISGYLICSILIRELREDRYSLLTFYERRARRILPALFAVLAFCLIGGWFLFPPPQYESLGWSAIAATLFASNIWFLRTTGDYFASPAEFEPLLHTWSLAVEEQFYIAFPLLLAAIYRLRKQLILPLLVLGCAASLIVSIWATTAHPTANFYLTPSRAWELGLGAFLAMGGAPNLRSKALNEVIALGGAAAIAFAIVSYSKETAFPGLAAVAPVAGTAALIWVGGNHQSLVTRLLSTKPFVAIGLISYSLYLWHWPILIVARNYVSSVKLPLGLAAAAIALSVFAAWLTWRYVEQPFRARGPKGRVSRGQVFALSGAGAALILAASGWIGMQSGVWSRIPAQVREVAELANRSALEQDCEAEIMRTQAPCVVGSKRAATQPRYLIWGDSHVGAMIPGIAAWAERRGEAARVFFYTGCSPVSGINRPNLGASHDCSGANERTLRHALADPDLEHVILAGRWPLWFSGERPEGEVGIAMRLGDAVTGREIDRKDYAARVRTGLETHVRQLREKGVDVTILSAVPELGFDPALVYINGQFLGRPAPIVTRASVAQRQASSLQILRDIAARNNARLIEMTDFMCEEVCPTQIEGQVLYRDDDHLSEYGSRRIIPLVLDQALQTSQEIP